MPTNDFCCVISLLKIFQNKLSICYPCLSADLHYHNSSSVLVFSSCVLSLEILIHFTVILPLMLISMNDFRLNRQISVVVVLFLLLLLNILSQDKFHHASFYPMHFLDFFLFSQQYLIFYFISTYPSVIIVVWYI